MVLGAFPALYVLISNAWYGGPLERNLPPGVSLEAIMGLLVVGMVMGLNHAFYSFIEHLNSDPTSDRARRSPRARNPLH